MANTTNFARTSAAAWGQSVSRGAQNTTAILPAFVIANVTPTSPIILAEYPITNTSPITIIRPLPDNIDTNTTFILAVRYVNSSNNVVRYVLHRPLGLLDLLYPTYNGQKLGASAVLEIWSAPDSDMAVLTGDATFTLGLLTFQGQTQLCFCGQVTADVLTLERNETVTVDFGSCNPLCTCLDLAAGQGGRTITPVDIVTVRSDDGTLVDVSVVTDQGIKTLRTSQ